MWAFLKPDFRIPSRHLTRSSPGTGPHPPGPAVRPSQGLSGLGSSNHTGVERKQRQRRGPKRARTRSRGPWGRKEAGRPRGVSIACTELVTVAVCSPKPGCQWSQAAGAHVSLSSQTGTLVWK